MNFETHPYHSLFLLGFRVRAGYGEPVNRVGECEDIMKLFSAMTGVMARRLGRFGGIDRTGNQNVSKRCEGAL